MSAAELEGQEQAMFAKWTESIFAQYERSELNFFEHNLEVRAHRARRVLCRARSSLRRNVLLQPCCYIQNNARGITADDALSAVKA
jgi:hypothetical protein